MANEGWENVNSIADSDRSYYQESLMGKAWMLGIKGESIEVPIHIYGEKGRVCQNLGVAVWLEDNAVELSEKYKDHLNMLGKLTFASYAYQFMLDSRFTDGYDVSIWDEVSQFVGDKIVRTIGRQAANDLDGYMPKSSLSSIGERIRDLLIREAATDKEAVLDVAYDGNVDSHISQRAGDFIVDELNEHFLRVRLGHYASTSYNDPSVVFFRISSKYNDWSDIIWQFVHDHGAIQTIFVDIDKWSERAGGKVLINGMDRKEFLSGDGVPTLASKLKEDWEAVVSINASLMKGRAWMISAAGEEVPVEMHIYAHSGVFQYNMDACFWVYNHCKTLPANFITEFNKACKSFAAWFATVQMDPCEDWDTFTSAFRNSISRLGGMSASTGVTEYKKPKTAEYLLESISEYADNLAKLYADGNKVSLNSADFVEDFLNEYFLKARQGDMYSMQVDSSAAHVMYFRITSEKTNWTAIIYEFVSRHKEIEQIYVDSLYSLLIDGWDREQLLTGKIPVLASKLNAAMSPEEREKARQEARQKAEIAKQNRANMSPSEIEKKRQERLAKNEQLAKDRENQRIMGRAWMLDKNGVAIPVHVHIYGQPGGVYENLRVAFWLKYCTSYKEIAESAIKTASLYVLHYALGNYDSPNLEDWLDEFRSEVYNHWAGLDRYAQAAGKDDDALIEDFIPYITEYLQSQDLTDYGVLSQARRTDEHCIDDIDIFIDQNFIRVREGDRASTLIHTSAANTLYVRINSNRYNWINQIYIFLNDHKQYTQIIVEDEKDNETLVNMSREEFLSADRLPFLGMRDEVIWEDAVSFNASENTIPGRAWMVDKANREYLVPCHVVSDSPSSCLGALLWLETTVHADLDYDKLYTGAVQDSVSNLRNYVELTGADLDAASLIRNRFPSLGKLYNQSLGIERVVEKLKPYFEDALRQGSSAGSSSVVDEVADILNNNYIRIRQGHEFYANISPSAARDLYIKIGSQGYDWTNQIYTFIARHRSYESIIIENDATGDLYEQFTREEFMSAKKLPFLGMRDEVIWEDANSLNPSVSM